MNAADPTPIDRLYLEACGIIRELQQNEQISLQNSASDNFRKTLLLAAASYFEHRICALLMDFVKERARGSVLIEQFVRKKAISRQYHTLFDWDSGNANKFFSWFGKEFTAKMAEDVRRSEDLEVAIKAFMEIGRERNLLVHLDYATFPLEKTLDEIYALYQKGLIFIERLPKAFRECDEI